MTIRTYLSLAAGASLLALAACNPAPLKHHSSSWSGDWGDYKSDWGDKDDGVQLKTISALTCPEQQGELTRTAQAADGKSCDYSGPNDETVRLTLVALDGHAPADALDARKTELKALVPAPPPGPVRVEASKGENGEKAKVDLPFLHVDADGGKADVKILGATIHADDDKAVVKASSGSHKAIVNAGPGGAEITAEDVGKLNAGLVYILAGDKVGPSGYRAVGYIARGPVEGPLVVAEFRSKTEHHDHDERHGDIGKLIELNVKP